MKNNYDYETLKNKTVFKCSYCTKVSLSAAAIYQHEIFCRKNPHNHILCFSCVHCEVVDSLDCDGSRCNYCSYNCRHLGGCNNPYCTDDRQRIVDFVCKIDNAKMYAPNKIIRKSYFKDILARCDRPMVDGTMECKNYKCKFDD